MISFKAMVYLEYVLIEQLIIVFMFPIVGQVTVHVIPYFLLVQQGVQMDPSKLGLKQYGILALGVQLVAHNQHGYVVVVT